MKKIFLSLFVFGLLYLGQKVRAEQINSFEADFKIKADASVEVKETINYDFGQEQKHGIFRTIPYIYQDETGKKSKISFSNFKAVDDTGAPYELSVSRQNNDWLLKIGDADVLVSGYRTYVISYTIKDGLKYFADHDELYWDAVGSEWQMPIVRSLVRVSLPTDVEADKLQAVCYYGVYGSNQTCVSSIESANSFVFSHEQILQPGEGLTIVAGWPKGVVKEPTARDRFLRLFGEYCPFLLPFIVLICFIVKWRRSGRDPKGRGTIIAQYEAPDKLWPAAVGTLLDEKVNGKDISAEIINLAVLGYLKIVKLDKKGVIKALVVDDYRLVKLKDEDDNLNGWQKELFRAIFGDKQEIDLSDLKKDFYSQARKLEKSLFKKLTDRKYFVSDPSKIQIKYTGLGVIFVFLGFPIAYILTSVVLRFGLDNNYPVWLFISFLLSMPLFFIFGPLMARKTESGVVAKEHILGLKLYLTVAEKDRLEFHNAPAKNPEHFEKLLPFAIALGVEKKWATQFKDLYNYQPTWYSDPNYHSLNTLAFVSSLSQFTALSNAVSSPASHSSSSGSGFSGGSSGGGGGGGGGGSW